MASEAAKYIEGGKTVLSLRSVAPDKYDTQGPDYSLESEYTTAYNAGYNRGRREAEPLEFKVIIHKGEQYFWGEVPALPGCFSQGDSQAELLENIKDAIRCWLEVANEPDDPVDGDQDSVESVAIVKV